MKSMNQFYADISRFLRRVYIRLSAFISGLLLTAVVSLRFHANHIFNIALGKLPRGLVLTVTRILTAVSNVLASKLVVKILLFGRDIMRKVVGMVVCSINLVIEALRLQIISLSQQSAILAVGGRVLLLRKSLKFTSVQSYLEGRVDIFFSHRLSKYRTALLVRDYLKPRVLFFYKVLFLGPVVTLIFIAYYVIAHNFLATVPYASELGMTDHQLEWTVYGSDSRVYHKGVRTNKPERYFQMHIWFYMRVEHYLYEGACYDVSRYPNAFDFNVNQFHPEAYLTDLKKFWAETPRPSPLKSPIGRYFIYFFGGDCDYHIQTNEPLWRFVVQFAEFGTRIAYLPGDILAALKISCGMLPDTSNTDFALYRKFFRMRDVVWYEFTTTILDNYREIKRFILDWFAYSRIDKTPLFQAFVYVITLLWYSVKFFASNEFVMGYLREQDHFFVWLQGYPACVFFLKCWHIVVDTPRFYFDILLSHSLLYLVGPWVLAKEAFLYFFDSLYQGLGIFLEEPYNRLAGIEPFHTRYGPLSILDWENHLVFHVAHWLPDLWMIFIPPVYFIAVAYLFFMLVGLVWFIAYRPLALLFVLLVDTSSWKPRPKAEVREIVTTQLVVLKSIVRLKYLITIEYFRLLNNIYLFVVLGSSQDDFDVSAHVKPLIQPLIDQFFAYEAENIQWVREDRVGCLELSPEEHYSLLQMQEKRRLDEAAARESLDGWSTLGNPAMPGNYEFITQVARMIVTPWAYGWAIMGVVGLSRRGLWARLFYDGIAPNVLNPLIAYDGAYYVTNPAEDYPCDWEIWDRMIEMYFPALDYLIELYWIDDCDRNDDDSYILLGNSAEQLIGVHRWFFFLFLSIALFAGISWICFRSMREFINSYWFTALILHTYGMVLIFEEAYGMSFIDYVIPGGAWFDSWALWKDTMLSGNGDLTSYFADIKMDLMERVLSTRRPAHLWGQVHQGRVWRGKQFLDAVALATALSVRITYITTLYNIAQQNLWSYWLARKFIDVFWFCDYYWLNLKVFVVQIRRWVRGDPDLFEDDELADEDRDYDEDFEFVFDDEDDANAPDEGVSEDGEDVNIADSEAAKDGDDKNS